MKVRDLFESRFLRAEDLGNARVRVTIEQVALETLHGSKKPVLYFVGKKKGLVVNQTRAHSLTRVLASDETNDWVGCQVTLYAGVGSMRDEQSGRARSVRMICIDERPESAVHPRREGEPEPGPPRPVTGDDIRW